MYVKLCFDDEMVSTGSCNKVKFISKVVLVEIYSKCILISQVSKLRPLGNFLYSNNDIPLICFY